jgi:hypothetical protein
VIRARYVYTLLAALAVLAAGCGGGANVSDQMRAEVAAGETQGPASTGTTVPDPGATLTPSSQAAAALPAGWKAFDEGAVTGALPSGWVSFVIDKDEYLRLAGQGLTQSLLSSSKQEEVLDRAADFAKFMVVLMPAAGGFPNMNVQPCFAAGRPLRAEDGGAGARSLHNETGLRIEVAGEVPFDDESFALFKVEAYENFAVYQAIVGTPGCVTVVTLSTLPADDAAVEMFKTFMSQLNVAK